MSPTVKTYSMLERLKRPDFGIHNARALSSVERQHRHEYFQVQLHVAGNAEHQVGARVLSLDPLVSFEDARVPVHRAIRRDRQERALSCYPS
jgi:hypothetical protein